MAPVRTNCRLVVGSRHQLIIRSVNLTISQSKADGIKDMLPSGFPVKSATRVALTLLCFTLSVPSSLRRLPLSRCAGRERAIYTVVCCTVLLSSCCVLRSRIPLMGREGMFYKITFKQYFKLFHFSLFTSAVTCNSTLVLATWLLA